jgi:predicted regulator of Ras-like GTPase activity (Roadblock/LC7/MglB family)
MSALRPELEAMVERLPGAVAACLMGFDGIPVETLEAVSLDDQGLDLGSLWVELSSVAAQIQRTGEVFATGPVEELTVRTERLTTVLRPISAEYFVALSMFPWASGAKGRYLLRVHGSRLVEAIA